MLFLLFWLTSLLTGSMINAILPWKPVGRAEFLLYATVMGMGAISLLIMLCGLASVLYDPVVWGIVLLLFTTGAVFGSKLVYRQFFGEKLNLLYGTSVWFKALIVLISLYAVYNLLSCLTPVTNGDSISWYLCVPRTIIENHSLMNIQLTQDYLSSNLPMGIYMLSIAGLVMHSEILSQLILGWLSSILAFLAVYVSIKRFAHRDAALLGAAIFYTMPTLAWLIESTKLDLGYTMFELTFWSLFLLWVKTKDKPALYISAIFLGLAIGSKYHSLIALTCAVLIVMLKLIIEKENLPSIIKTAFFFSLISLIVGCPSYIKNALLVHDPVFPFLSNAQLVEGEGFDIYHSLLDYPRYLFNMVFAREFTLSPTHYADRPLGFLFIMLLPLLFSKKLYKHLNKYVIVTTFLYFLVMSLAVMVSVWPFPRHILPAVGVMLILMSIGYGNYSDSLYRKQIGYAAVLIMLLTIVFFNLSLGDLKRKAAYLTGRVTKAQYLDKAIFSSYWHMDKPMLDYVKSMPADTRILALDFGNGYYVSKPLLKKTYVYNERNFNRLLSMMHSDKITHIYLSEPAMKYLITTYNHGNYCVLLSHPEYLKPAFISGEKKLYQVIYTP